MRLVVYFDNILIMNGSNSRLLGDLNAAISLLEFLDVLINKKIRIPTLSFYRISGSADWQLSVNFLFSI